jgi:hypothetical protein
LVFVLFVPANRPEPYVRLTGMFCTFVPITLPVTVPSPMNVKSRDATSPFASMTRSSDAVVPSVPARSRPSASRTARS